MFLQWCHKRDVVEHFHKFSQASQLVLVEENKKELDTRLNGQMQSLQAKLIDKEDALSKMKKDHEQVGVLMVSRGS